jgi:hypothetical protein
MASIHCVCCDRMFIDIHLASSMPHHAHGTTLTAGSNTYELTIMLHAHLATLSSSRNRTPDKYRYRSGGTPVVTFCTM